MEQDSGAAHAPVNALASARTHVDTHPPAHIRTSHLTPCFILRRAYRESVFVARRGTDISTPTRGRSADLLCVHHRTLSLLYPPHRTQTNTAAAAPLPISLIEHMLRRASVLPRAPLVRVVPVVSLAARSYRVLPHLERDIEELAETQKKGRWFMSSRR